MGSLTVMPHIQCEFHKVICVVLHNGLDRCLFGLLFVEPLTLFSALSDDSSDGGGHFCGRGKRYSDRRTL